MGAETNRAGAGGPWRNFLLLACSLAVSLALGEFVLRALGYYGYRGGRVEKLRLVDDEVLDFRHVPNASWFRDGHRYWTNAKGWRDYEYEFEKAPDAFRIVAVGDSVTHGYGVDLDDIYTKRLEAMLRASDAGRRFEVVGLTVGALNTHQEAHLLRVEGLQYDPDLVVVGYVLNDPERGQSLRRSRQIPASMGGRLKALLRGSSLLHLVYTNWQRIAWNARVLLGREEVADYVRRDYFSRIHEDPEKWATVEQGMDTIAELCRERQIPVVWLIFPVLHGLEEYRWEAVHRKVAEAAAGRGFDVVDLLPRFRQYRAKEVQVDSGDHVHPNPLGHRLAAEALLELVVERRWIAEEAEEG